MRSMPQIARVEPMGSSARHWHAPLKLMLPVDATKRSRWSIGYAMGLQRERPIEAHLLFVAEPITSWQVLRFKTQAEVCEFQRQYGQAQLEDAAEPLRQAQIPLHTHYREGNIAFEILDCAEQIGCSRIVLPQPRPRWVSLFARDIVREVLERSSAVKVVVVDEQGVDGSDMPIQVN